MKLRPLQESWYRCRIRVRSSAPKRWIYYQVSAKNQRELRREARYWAMLALHRQIFDYEAVYADKLPNGLKRSRSVSGKLFYLENVLASVPEAAV